MSRDLDLDFGPDRSDILDALISEAWARQNRSRSRLRVEPEMGGWTGDTIAAARQGVRRADLDRDADRDTDTDSGMQASGRFPGLAPRAFLCRRCAAWARGRCKYAAVSGRGSSNRPSPKGLALADTAEQGDRMRRRVRDRHRCRNRNSKSQVQSKSRARSESRVKSKCCRPGARESRTNQAGSGICGVRSIRRFCGRIAA